MIWSELNNRDLPLFLGLTLAGDPILPAKHPGYALWLLTGSHSRFVVDPERAHGTIGVTPVADAEEHRVVPLNTPRIPALPYQP